MLALMPKDVDREGASRFVDALGETTAAIWMAAADVAARASQARTRVTDVITGCAERLGVYDDLWELADGVETAAWYVLPDWCRRPRSPADAHRRRHAMEAARLTAYAILLRAHLAEKDFELLSEPFRDMVARVIAA